MRTVLLLTSAFCLLLSGAAAAQEASVSGLTVTSVAIEIEGRRARADDLRPLIETREGFALDPRQARESIAQLFAAGRFADVRVEAVRDGAGVALVYKLEPRHPVTRIEVGGRPGIAKTALTEALETRFEGLGAAPSEAEAVAAVILLLRDEGFLAARASMRAQVAHAPHATTLFFDVEAGEPARIRSVKLEGSWPEPEATLLGRLHARQGQPYRRAELRAALDALVADMRRTGRYAAAASHSATPSADGTGIDLLIDAEAGPLVDVRFEGDLMPRDRLDALVPIERERAVDIDLLEDATIRIVNDLRKDGYWRANATYRTAERDGRLEVTFTITRGARYRLGALRVEGHSAVSAEALLSFVGPRPGDIFVEAPLENGALAIRDYYRRAGFASAEVTLDVAEAPRPEGNPGDPGDPEGAARMNARMIVSEGPQSFVRDVTFRGATAIPDADLRRRMQSRAGEPYYLPFLSLDRDALVRAYLDRGYQQATVAIEPVADGQGSNVVLAVDVNEGPQTIVDRVIVTGNVRTDTQTILDELTLRQGSPLGLADLVESQRRLSALGLFRRVRLTEGPRQPGSRAVDLIVSLEEAPSTTIGYGGGIEVLDDPRTNQDGTQTDRLEVQPRGFFEITRRNIAGGNRALSLFSRVSLGRRDDVDDPGRDGTGFGISEYRVVGTYREPRAFRFDLDLLVSAGIERSKRTSFNFNRDTVAVEVLRRLSPSLRASGRYSLEYTELFDVRIKRSEQLLIDRLFPQFRLSIFSGSLVRDTRGDPVDPERGSLVALDLDTAPRALGSEVGFIKSFAQAFYYKRLPVGPRIVFAGGARLGLARGFSRIVESSADAVPLDLSQVEVRDLPASQRFFAGGSTTVRGFQLDRLGVPGILNSDGLSNGGNAMLVLNAELRLPIWKDVGAVTFVDAGNVFARVGGIDLTELRPTAGVGLRYKSPIGPLRVDIGFKLNRRAFPTRREHGSEWHFSLGQAF